MLAERHQPDEFSVGSVLEDPRSRFSPSGTPDGQHVGCAGPIDIEVKEVEPDVDGPMFLKIDGTHRTAGGIEDEEPGRRIREGIDIPPRKDLDARDLGVERR
jgi:hypothetical protein